LCFGFLPRGVRPVRLLQVDAAEHRALFTAHDNHCAETTTYIVHLYLE